MRRSALAFASANRRFRVRTRFQHIQALAMNGLRATGTQFMDGTSGVTVTGRILRTEALTGPLRTTSTDAITPDGGKATARRGIATTGTKTTVTTVGKGLV